MGGIVRIGCGAGFWGNTPEGPAQLVRSGAIAHRALNTDLGARPIAEALAIGPLMPEFGWRADDRNRLSAGSLAGHVIERGAQATGAIASLRHDPRGKALAEALLDLPTEAPAAWLEAVGSLAGGSERLDP